MAKDLSSLTGLRGCAAVLVMVYHFRLSTPPTGPLSQFIANGYLWVDLFFILSGFVLAHTYGQIFTGRWSGADFVQFLGRRIARIYPLYLAVTLATVAAGMVRRGQMPSPAFDFEIVANLLLIQAWGIARSLEGAAWSISTEWAAYLMFPVLVWSSLRGPWWRVAAAGLAATGALLFIATSAGPFAYPYEARTGPLDIYSAATPAPLLRCLCSFVLGLIAYRVASSLTPAWRRRSGVAAALLLAAILAGMALPGTDVLVVMLSAALLVALAAQTGTVATVLSTGPMQWLGNISYSVYLLHGKFRHVEAAAYAALPDWGQAGKVVSVGGTSVLVLACSTLSWHLIERPARKILRGNPRLLAGHRMIRHGRPAVFRQLRSIGSRALRHVEATARPGSTQKRGEATQGEMRRSKPE